MKGDIAVIKTGDDYPYPYNHNFPHYHRLVEGNYLELHKEEKDNDVYHIDYQKAAVLSPFLVVRNRSTPKIVHEMKYGKLVPIDLQVAMYIKYCASLLMKCNVFISKFSYFFHSDKVC